MLESKTTVIALSGGVDSSVAACQVMLQQQQQQPNAFKIHAIHMSNWNAQDDASLAPTVSCSSDADWKDAQAVAKHLALPHIQRLSFEREYWINVWEPFVDQLSASDATSTAINNENVPDPAIHNLGSFNNTFTMGNPDIDCNKHVKFGALTDWCAQQFGDDGYQLATGHYARLYRPGDEDETTEHVIETLNENPWLVDDNEDSPLLLSAVDASKDQTYFLAACSATSFRNVSFPLGHLNKKVGSQSVRALAQTYQLPTAAKRDSVGICFVGTRHGGFRRFLQEYLPVPAMDRVEFVDVESNALVGTTLESDFACLWTIGQGAKIGGSAQKYFVAGHDAASSNRVFVCAGTNHTALFAESLTVKNMHWVAGAIPAPLQANGTMRIQCRIRHLQPLMDATLVYNNEGATQAHDELIVDFDEPVRGVTKGQFAAFYVGAICLGGGPIASVGQTLYEQGRELLCTSIGGRYAL
ncbi:hypothetical protein MPSEU_000537500 [Mayamaea pseudoterrestris]|nr:hypothetical protein MPSEU_000537500 [Mayamaea pseudoterrestris]